MRRPLQAYQWAATGMRAFDRNPHGVAQYCRLDDAEAERDKLLELIADLDGHEGAEGWSEGMRERIDAALGGAEMSTRLVSILERHLGRLSHALFKTEWRDGIDIDKPISGVQEAFDEYAAPYKEEAERRRAQVDRYEAENAKLRELLNAEKAALMPGSIRMEMHVNEGGKQWSACKVLSTSEFGLDTTLGGKIVALAINSLIAELTAKINADECDGEKDA